MVRENDFCLQSALDLRAYDWSSTEVYSSNIKKSINNLL